jgi:hypothetical protein
MAPAAPAAVGAVLGTVDLPPAAVCGGPTSGTAVAIVPGGRVGLPKIPILLVTTCVDGGQAKLFFIDPGNPPAVPTTVAKTITTVPVAGLLRWDALTLRADKGDLLACGVFATSPTTRLYAIDISPFNNTTPAPGIPDGTATLVVNGPTDSTCAGIAWDVSSNPKTIFQSSTGTNILHFTASGGALPPIASGCPGGAGVSVNGLAVAGPSLFVGCPEVLVPASEPQIRRLDKITGAPVGAGLPNPTADIGDLECDGGSFGRTFRDVVWVKDPFLNQLNAVEIPGGVCGLTTGPPVFAPAACPAGYRTNEDGTTMDTDGDGLPDCWEDQTFWGDGRPGIDFDGSFDGPGETLTRDLVLCADAANLATCADPLQKDIFVELDYMQFHLPDPANVAAVVQAFANAPGLPSFPSGPGPIRLHVQIGDQMPHNNNVALEPCTGPAGAGHATFESLKAAWFGTTTERGLPPARKQNALGAKGFAYRYGQVVHNLSGLGTTSGCAEIGGNDFLIALGSWGLVNGHGVGTKDQWTGTFMHELGHTLGLRHGGGDSLNCKPNYASVMNYMLQFSSTIPGRPLDYSRRLLGVPIVTPTGSVTGLDEANLDELDGVGGFAGGKVAFGPVPPLGKATVAAADTAINWSKTGGATDLNLSLDLNQTTNAGGGCPASVGEILEGFNDWENLSFNFRASVDFADGASATHEDSKDKGSREMTLEEALAFSLDVIEVLKPQLNSKSNETVEVAIFGRSDPDSPLDATDIDHASITLRGTNGATWAVPVRLQPHGRDCKVKDQNKDRVPDLLCKFNIPKHTLTPGETTAVLDAETFGGQPVHSSDAIKVK